MKHNSRFGEFGLIIANSHPALGLEVAHQLGVTPLQVESKLFPNGELNVRRLCDISGRDICIFSSLHAGYDTVRELRLICGTIRGSASRVFGVFPFVRDGKSDHVKQFGEPVAYNDTAELISSSGLDVIAIFDQHSSQHPNSYNTLHYRLRAVHHIYLMRILIEYAMARRDQFDSVLALDEGGFKRNMKIAEMLKLPVSFIIKDRDAATRKVNIEASRIVGNVAGQRVAAFDDMLQGGGTLEAGAVIAKNHGAKAISFFVVHDDFTPATFGRINPLLENGTIDRIYILETIPLRDKGKWHKNLAVISSATLIAKVISTIHEEGHMRELFLEL
ncbi:MAG: Ribose-phosphate pyrophosphokinase [Parcubacteria group bacterium GW2011_GWC2_42_12]|uniref:Ribose-phosphate pyrophosphokinase n=1 Tax=Candidatus Falkowbacteria bacterium GW2011_GWA2_41_14 TaxID=1618635 RepID=A0A0G0USU6_9BACT|nr:MAG: Ribose-phosphate pyrophosphokinase [Candidatus Falkowbacteria bacterium GW2011_GWA2_41_14]KKS33884.1 MAG: Ribose-phosphate pyrophosphokinase [Parcubacteria group bacterium GW2011_GWC2_42_12]